MAASDDTTILLVDDDPQVLELFRRRLAEAYDVRTASSGDEALQRIDDEVEAVLLDRRMPGPSGAEVLERLRASGYEQPVAMVTAVDPDFDVIEMGFDDYVVKPVTAAELHDLVESLLLRRAYDDVLREYFALASKVSALRASKPPERLSANPEYTQAIDRLNEIKQEARHSLESAMDAGMLEELMWESFLDGSEVGTIPPE